MNLNEIALEAEAALQELVEIAQLGSEDIVVIGCSTSEVHGERIGTSTSMDIAEHLYSGLAKVMSFSGITLAFQCCEHINRALVLPQAAAERLQLDPVLVIPVPKAGGAMASYAYQRMRQAAVVESLNQKARAGLDIGDTLIGMHVHPVVVPLRLKQKTIGSAHLQAARSRTKMIGGQRAVYDEEEAIRLMREYGYKE